MVSSIVSMIFNRLVMTGVLFLILDNQVDAGGYRRSVIADAWRAVAVLEDIPKAFQQIAGDQR